MRKKILYVLMYFTTTIYSQVEVKQNTFIFNKASLLFIKAHLNLSETSSSLFLRNNGQLIQGTTATSDNKGLGFLSVYQVGSVNNFGYNYWCSPIGKTSSSSGNEYFSIDLLSVPNSIQYSNPIVALPYNSLDGLTNTGYLAIASRWIWRFLSSDVYADWVYTGNNFDITAGQGFTMKGTKGTDNTNVSEITVNNPGSAQRYDFRGKPNDGTIPVQVAIDNFTLTGNPYPSFLDVNHFLLDQDNANCTGTAYYWEQKENADSHILTDYEGGYGVYSPISLFSEGIYVAATFDTYTSSGELNTIGTSSGLSINRRYAPIGQGFMIEGAVNGNVALKNKHRVYHASNTVPKIENKSTAIHQSNQTIIPQIRLNISFDNKKTRQIVLALLDEATDEVDRGIDARNPNGDHALNDAYFLINNDSYIIQGIKFDNDKTIKLGLNIGSKNKVSISLASDYNFNQNTPIYLYDNLDDSYHNLRIEKYEVSLASGIFNDRFKIVFKNELANVETPSNDDSFFVISDYENQLIKIYNPELLNIEEVELFTIYGKLLYKKNDFNIESLIEFSTSTYSSGVYFLKIKSKTGVAETKKFLIKNFK